MENKILSLFVSSAVISPFRTIKLSMKIIQYRIIAKVIK